jgi:nitrate reductase delta subunit
METTALVALGYRYPTPTHAADLARAMVGVRHVEVARPMGKFVDAVSRLELGEWEELHTATLDLSAPFVPYVGHIVWGENYRRGEFMADLNSAMARAGVSLDGELPDHIEPVLRYLAATDEPLADLAEVLPGAVTEMEQTLRRAQPDNPYCHLLAATVACAANRPVTIGGRR